MLKNERKIIYMVGLAGKENDHHRSWTGIQMNFCPLVHPCLSFLHKIPEGVVVWFLIPSSVRNA